MKSAISLFAIVTLAGCLFASDKWRVNSRGAAAWVVTNTAKPTPPPPVVNGTTASESTDALDEVNAKRATRGLQPLVRDAALTEAAYKCAKARASRHVDGHLPESDFSLLSSSVNTDGVAAGCAALDTSWGWQSCCWDDPGYTHGGAAWVMGDDGKRYMHIFVSTQKQQERKAASVQAAPVESISSGSCASGQCGSASVGARRGVFSRRR